MPQNRTQPLLKVVLSLTQSRFLMIFLGALFLLLCISDLEETFHKVRYGKRNVPRPNPQSTENTSFIGVKLSPDGGGTLFWRFCNTKEELL